MKAFYRVIKGKANWETSTQTWQCHNQLSEGLSWIWAWNLLSFLLHMAQDQAILEQDWARCHWRGFYSVSRKDTWAQGDHSLCLLFRRTLILPAALQKRIVSMVAFALKWYTCSLSSHTRTLSWALIILHCNNCSIPYCLCHGQSVPRNPKQLTDCILSCRIKKNCEAD